MRLESITVRNYRVHRELRIDLDPARTLIEGPNESGKSTLIEAVHRALFLRAKTGGEIQRSMVSHVHPGHPEIEVCFEARGQRWRLIKRFSGPNGTATLSAIGGETLTGDEAEEKLGELLGAEIIGGHGARHVEKQWAHLWIWQGCAGEDPTSHANAQCDELLARLQREGGAAAVQSECDKRVADEMAQRVATIFKDNGEPRAASDLGRAHADETQACKVHAAAQQALERLEKAIDDFIAAEETIRAATDALAQLQPQHAELKQKLARVVELRGDEKIQEPAAVAAAKDYDTFAVAHARIGQLREQSRSATAALEPLEAEAARLFTQEAERRKSDPAAEAAWNQASETVRLARLRGELMAALVQRFEKTATRDQIDERLKQVFAAREQRVERESTLAKLPVVTAAKFRSLQKLESERAEAAAALGGMAAGIDVLASDQPVCIGRRLVEPGGAEILTEETEIEIGTAIRLRVRPGGGTSLAAARERVRDAREKFQRELDSCGVAALESAADVLARRQQIEAEIKMIHARIEGLGGGAIEKEFAAAQTECADADADVERRAALVENPPVPATLEEARALASRTAQQLRDAEQHEAAARAERKDAAERLRKSSECLEAHRQILQKKKEEVTDLTAQLRELERAHGADDARAAKLVTLAAVRTEAQKRLDDTRRAIAELQPELLERDRERLSRAIAQHTVAQRAAEEKRATARGQLLCDGATDPQAELALAQEGLRGARDRVACEQCRADAIALLRELFVEEQKALAEQFTGPLAAKISGYLECLFGPGARAELTLQGGNFQGLRLIRSAYGGGAFQFENLSGGTKEQLAAAVRVALAEVLAEAHDGCLPVVLDDAFAYSDPERVQVLQRMLDLAAERGLQIILSTCNMADYAHLRAKQITLDAR